MSEAPDPLLEIVLNLAQHHREHEKFYAASPLGDAITLQRASRALKALAERWSTVTPQKEPLPSPFAGADDLNDPRATETLGILFMEGAGEPAEVTRLKADLAALAEGLRSAGDWLGQAMTASWGVAEALLGYPQLADLLGERHRIISNNAQNAGLATLAARDLDRALAILGRVSLTPQDLRADLAAERHAPAYVLAATELLDHAADLLALSATLVHDNERRWRVFHDRVAQLRATS